MTRTSIAVALLVAGACLALSAPSSAQISTDVDEQGKVVYINGDSPRARAQGANGASPVPSHMLSNSGEPSVNVMPASSSEDQLERIVRAAAEKHQVDPALVKAVIGTESGWNPLAVSRKGAEGLMQLVPATAQRFGVGNPFDPAQNVEGGTTYLRSLLDRYHGDLTKSLAAYNAGEHAVDQSGGIPAYPETQRYVEKVTDAYFRPGSGRDPTLWSPPRPPVRKEVQPNGQIIFTNE